MSSQRVQQQRLVTPNTTLPADGDDYLLSGAKYCSNGTLYSDYALVRTADASGANAAVLIPVGREGIELIDDWDGLGQRLTATGTTRFRNVRVKRQVVVFDAPGAGYGIPYSNTFAQLFLTAINAGIARGVAGRRRAGIVPQTDVLLCAERRTTPFCSRPYRERCVRS